MNRPRSTSATQVENLAQQKVDFTAEGAPPPGKVASSIPATPGKTTRGKITPAAPNTPAAVRRESERAPSRTDR